MSLDPVERVRWRIWLPLLSPVFNYFLDFDVWIMRALEL